MGAQTITASGQPAVRFAISTLGQLSNPDSVYYEIDIDTNGDGIPDYAVVAEDQGLLTGTGSFSGQLVVATFNLATGNGVIRFAATAPLNGSAVLLPSLLSDLGISGSQAFSYNAYTQDLNTGNADFLATGYFNPLNNTISTGQAIGLAAGAGTTTVPISYNSAGAATSPTLGVMVISLDNNTSHGGEAFLLPLN